MPSHPLPPCTPSELVLSSNRMSPLAFTARSEKALAPLVAGKLYLLQVFPCRIENQHPFGKEVEDIDLSLASILKLRGIMAAVSEDPAVRHTR